MDLGLKGKVIIVTGGARGIGEGISKVLSGEGANVVIADYNYENAQETAKKLAEEYGTKTFAVKVDATNEESVIAMYKTVLDEMGEIGGLVNNVGAGLARKMCEDLTVADWDRANDLNVKSMFLCSREFVKYCLANNVTARVVNLSSKTAVRSGHKRSADYATYKSAVIGFTRAMSNETADRGISFNAILPGYVVTPLTHYDDPTPANQERLSKLPRHVFSTPEDMGNIVAFLLSQKSSEIIGTTIDATGGLLF